MLTQDQRVSEVVSLLLTAGEVGELLRISERTVWRLLSMGELPRPIKLGHSCRWPRKSIEQFVTQKAEQLVA